MRLYVRVKYRFAMVLGDLKVLECPDRGTICPEGIADVLFGGPDLELKPKP